MGKKYYDVKKQQKNRLLLLSKLKLSLSYLYYLNITLVLFDFFSLVDLNIFFISDLQIPANNPNCHQTAGRLNIFTTMIK